MYYSCSTIGYVYKYMKYVLINQSINISVSIVAGGEGDFSRINTGP